MRIWCLQHFEREGPALIEEWAQQRGHEFKIIERFRNEAIPRLELHDGLVLLGGPMSVNDEGDYPWIRPELAAIAHHAQNGGRIFGVCLGAQLIAKSFGAMVYPAKTLEVGWFPIRFAGGNEYPEKLPKSIHVLHWHGETFDLPYGVRRLASSAVCRNQAFTIGSRVIGLQFHLEVNAALLERLLETYFPIASPKFPYVQDGKQIIEELPRRQEQSKQFLFSLLDWWTT